MTHSFCLVHFFKVGNLYPEGPGEPQEIKKSGNVMIRLEGEDIKAVSSKRGSQTPLHQICWRAFKVHIPRHAVSTLQSWRWNSVFYLFFIIILIANSPPTFIFYLFIFGCTGMSLLGLGFLWSGLWASRWGGFSCCEHWLQSLNSVAVVYRVSCPAPCGIFLDQGSNLCPGAPEKSRNLHFK